MLASHRFNSVRNMPPLSKRAMLEALGRDVASSNLAGRNTLDYTDAAGVRRIRLHKTDILTIWPNGAFEIATGGWNTITTRGRLNQFLPEGWGVYTSRGEIHLIHRKASAETGAGVWRFRETIKVSAKGSVKPDVSDAKMDALRKQIGAYMRAWRKRGLPTREESGGDPWVFGDAKVSESTMLDWVKSQYVHRRLFDLAHRWAGTSEFGIAYYTETVDRRGGKLDRFDQGRIRRYIRACLGLAA